MLNYMNELIYDNCEYNTKLSESVGPLEYMLDPMQYENCNKCRIELGIVGGNNVSHVKGNLVDLESDLMQFLLGGLSSFN